MRGKTVKYILDKHILGYLGNKQKATDEINNRLNKQQKTTDFQKQQISKTSDFKNIRFQKNRFQKQLITKKIIFAKTTESKKQQISKNKNFKKQQISKNNRFKNRFQIYLFKKLIKTN